MMLRNLILPLAALLMTTQGFSQDLTEKKFAGDEKAKVFEGWNNSGLVGAKLNTSESAMVPSQKDGLTQIFGLNLDLAGIYKSGDLTWKNTLADETAFSRLPGLPKASKTADEIKLGSQLNYALNQNPDLGAYSKLGLRSNLLTSEDVREETTGFVAAKRNGELVTESTNIFRTGTSFGRVITREAVGAFYTPDTPAEITSELRFGFGLEQSTVKEDQFLLADDKTTDTIEYAEIDGYHIGGFEYGLDASYKLAEKVSLLVAADGLTPVLVDQKIKDTFGNNTVKLTSWTVSTKTAFTLSTWLSLAWELKLRREPLVQPEVQKSQALALNATYTLF